MSQLSLLYLEMSFTAWESKERVIGETGFKTWEVFFKIALHALCFYNLRNKYEQILVKTIWVSSCKLIPNRWNSTYLKYPHSKLVTSIRFFGNVLESVTTILSIFFYD